MIVIDETVWTDAQPGEVFEYLADFTTTTEWEPGTMRTTRIHGDGGLGTVYRNISMFAGRRTELEYLVVLIEPGHRIRLRGENSSLIAYDTITVLPNRGGTLVCYRAEFAFRGVLAVVEPLLRIPVRALGAAGVAGMRAALSRAQVSPTAER